MRQSITTKYMGPTNFRGSRVKAKTESGITKTIHWDCSLNAEENHKMAARELIKSLKWEGKGMAQWKCGSLKNCFVFVYDDGDSL